MDPAFVRALKLLGNIDRAPAGVIADDEIIVVCAGAFLVLMQEMRLPLPPRIKEALDREIARITARITKEENEKELTK